MPTTAEHRRLQEHRERRANWKLWGPYLSERAWGTVREDYSPDGSAWEYFSHDQARSRAYRWNEDGLAGICDRNQYICFALALWNGRDPILKERLFGLTGPEGNHGEDVKEYYFYLDSTPTHSYMKMLYKYPHIAYPYVDLVQENGRRGYHDFEYELLDTGIFRDSRYFDVAVEYAKAGQADILVQISVTNRGPTLAPCHVLPQIWFRNTWSWGYPAGPMQDVPGKPVLSRADSQGSAEVATLEHPAAGDYFFYADSPRELIFTENETNAQRLFGAPNASAHVKDAFHRYVIFGESNAVNPQGVGTKAAAVYIHEIPPGETRVCRLRLSAQPHQEPFAAGFDGAFARRLQEADAFYADIQRPDLGEDERSVQRQALAGMMWTKQLYYYDIPQWLHGDPAPPPPSRHLVRNQEWDHLNNFDVISMPDKWEYPWYAVWDLAFHAIPLSLIDADFAKRQLELMTREWYMHPNGALPAYEWSFGDSNPPVHAWAAWRIYKIDAKQQGQPDRAFLEGIFHKLLLNFTWWVNRKDEDGRNVFQGGFLGLDNISIFNRSAELPTGGHIDQSDGTAWMGFFSLMMMKIALELAVENSVYQDTATKFFEHFLRIADAMVDGTARGHALWDPEDAFFYDVLHLPDDSSLPLRVRSLVGLMPLIAVETLEPDLLDAMPDFKRRMHWFMANRPHLADNMASIDVPGIGQRHLISFLNKERLLSLLRFMLDESEFLSEYGIRSLSKVYEGRPYQIRLAGQDFTIEYQPAESRSGLFGGNSNWRGPIWFPINFLIIDALQRFHHYYGDEFKVECPTGSGRMATLAEVAEELSQRLMRIFLRDEEGRRPVYAGLEVFQSDPHWRDHILFYEYFHGDNGAGLGATHQTGWTGLVAKIIQRSG